MSEFTDDMEGPFQANDDGLIEILENQDLTNDLIEIALKKITKDKDECNGGSHIKEDLLYHAFVRYVAKHGDGAIKSMAQKIIATEDIEINRWYE